MCNVESVSFPCKGALLGGERAQCQLGTRFDCGNRQVGMTGFGIGSCSALRPHLGAKLPLYTTETLSGWLYRRIRVVIDDFETSYVSLIHGLSQNPPQQSLGYADDLIFGMCDVRVCLTKIPKSRCVFLPLQHWIAAKTYHRGYTQSLSLWLTQQRHKCRRTTRPTY